MSNLIATLAAVSVSLFMVVMVVGCATNTEDSEEQGSDTSENVAAKADETTKTESAGLWCTCPAGQEMSSDGLCYVSCKANYTGEGPVCWEECASGFTDTGMFCQRNAKIISADNSSCKWYDKCGLTLDKGCSTCPSGYSNDGCTCRIDAYIYAKGSYGRGAGSTDETCSTSAPTGGHR